MKIGKMVEKSPDGFIDFYQYHFTIKWQSKDFWLLVQCSPPTMIPLDSYQKVLVGQSCLTLCNPIEWSPLDSSVNGIFQARVLDWVAISFCNIRKN